MTVNSTLNDEKLKVDSTLIFSDKFHLIGIDYPSKVAGIPLMDFTFLFIADHDV